MLLNDNSAVSDLISMLNPADPKNLENWVCGLVSRHRSGVSYLGSRLTSVMEESILSSAQKIIFAHRREIFSTPRGPIQISRDRPQVPSTTAGPSKGPRLGYAFGLDSGFAAGLASFAAAGLASLAAGGFASFAGAGFASSFFSAGFASAFFSAAGFGALAAGATGFSSSLFFFATLWSFGSIRFFRYAGTMSADFASV